MDRQKFKWTKQKITFNSNVEIYTACYEYRKEWLRQLESIHTVLKLVAIDLFVGGTGVYSG